MDNKKTTNTAGRRTDKERFLAYLRDLSKSKPEGVSAITLQQELKWKSGKFSRVLEGLKVEKFVEVGPGRGGVLKLIQGPHPLSTFISYSHKDQEFLELFESHLSILVRKNIIKPWTDHEINAGANGDEEIAQNLEQADICVFLVSSDFIRSDYCYSKELSSALDRHEDNQTRIIPVIIRACLWKESPLGSIQALPKNGHPVASHPNRDSAMMEVVEGIQKVANEMRKTT